MPQEHQIRMSSNERDDCLHQIIAPFWCQKIWIKKKLIIVPGYYSRKYGSVRQSPAIHRIVKLRSK